MFDTRDQAGLDLSQALDKLRDDDLVVVAIPRGGVPVALPVAEAFGVSLVLVASRRIPHPSKNHLSIGAVTEDGTIVLNEPLVSRLRLSNAVVNASAEDVWEELQRRIKRCRGDRELQNLSGKTVVIIDDGLASGYTMLAAVRSVQKHNPDKVVVAVPVAQRGALDLVSPHVDEVICLRRQKEIPSFTVATSFRSFPDVTDEDIAMSLERASRFKKEAQ